MEATNVHANSSANPEPSAASGPSLLAKASWFDAHWMFISGAIFPIAVVVLLLWFPGPLTRRLGNRLFVGWLVVPFYCWHQFEEHGYDLRGWRYAFVPSFNHGIGSQLFKVCDELGHLTCPLDPRITVYINVCVVWMGFVVTMLVVDRGGQRFSLAGYANWGTAVVNGLLGHLVPMLAMFAYNPGAAQSVVMVAVGGWLIVKNRGWVILLACMANGIAFHIISFAIGINLMFSYGLPSEVVALISFLASSVLPLCVSLCLPVGKEKDDPTSDYSSMEEASTSVLP